MDLIRYEKLVSSESRARRYLLGFCWKNQQRFCLRCGTRKLYRLQDRRYRCSRCGYTFHDFSGRWLSRGNLSAQDWLRLCKLFELEVSTRKAAGQLGRAYSTTYRATTTLRLSLLHGADAELTLGGEVEMDEAYFGGRRKGKRGRGAAGKVPVFGILGRDGKVFVEAMPNLKARQVLDLAVRKVRRGSIVYTDRYQIYDALMFCGYRHLRINHQTHFARGRVYINGLEGFWSFAKQRLAQFHGISPERFPLYLNEMAFRYNHRDEDLFELFAQHLTLPVPNLS